MTTRSSASAEELARDRLWVMALERIPEPWRTLAVAEFNALRPDAPPGCATQFPVGAPVWQWWGWCWREGTVRGYTRKRIVIDLGDGRISMASPNSLCRRDPNDPIRPPPKRVGT